MPMSVSSMVLFTGSLEVHVTFVETGYDQHDYDYAYRIEVKGDRRDRRRPKSAHPFVIYNLNHLL